MSEQDYNRQPFRVIELEQPRCSLRFGTLPCTATGTPLCYQTFWTCKDRENYTPDGFIRWRFYDGRNGDPFIYEEFASENEIGTNAFPVLRSANTNSTQLNVGGQDKNKSPFGVKSKLTVELDEFEFDDHVGDFYLNDPERTSVVAGWGAKFLARNLFFPGMIIRDYRGYQGQTLAEMQVSQFILDNVELAGPKSIRLTGRDPLDLVNDEKAQFPRSSEIQLLEDVGAGATSISVFCAETELSSDYGNTGSRRYMRFGDEIIEYTGWTGTEPEFDLTGVTRGVLGTQAEGHDETDSAQRVGRYENIKLYKVAQDLLENHSTIPPVFFDFAQWESEDPYLSTLQTSATVTDPEAVEKLLAELSRDGLFFIWWDERDQKIPLQAVRPPKGVPTRFSDDLNILQDSWGETAEPDDRITRVTILYNQRDPTVSLDESTNYQNQRRRIDALFEEDASTGGSVRENRIFSRWINTAANATLVATALLRRYTLIPRYVKLQVDAKDREIGIADVVDLDTRHKVTTEGVRVPTRYQVIALEESEPGELVDLSLQSYLYIGKFAIIMENDAPNYADATEEERQNGAWIAQNDGTMPDGSEPYLIQ